MEEWLLALDFGGTKHTAGLISGRSGVQAHAWQAHERVLAPPDSTGETDLQIMLDLAHRLLARARPSAIGVSFGGPVDFTTGTVRLSHHVPGWENTPLEKILERALGAPARVDNDANVAALGEHRFGAGRGYQDIMYITVSTGVGGGWVLGGKPWRGAGGMAGEIGHTVVDPSGPVCLCGKRGCVERLASGPYMAQRARDIIANEAFAPGAGEILLGLAGGDLHAITAQTISQAAARGDVLARGILEDAARALGVGIGNAANLVNPQRFILGGGVTKSGPLFWDAVQQAARQTALPEVSFDIVPAELGDDAPLWGAVALAQDALRPSGSEREP